VASKVKPIQVRRKTVCKSGRNDGYRGQQLLTRRAQTQYLNKRNNYAISAECESK